MPYNGRAFGGIFKGRAIKLSFGIFKRSEKNMPFTIEIGDITNEVCDAIVNAANNTLLGGGGVDGAIHKKAGKELLEECKALGGCKTGRAKITKGYNLPCRYVIHTVGPVWRGGKFNEENLLKSCYIESLKLAEKYSCKSVAFPLISAGAYNYPKAEAFRVAVKAITEYLNIFDDYDIYVKLVIYNTENLTDVESMRLLVKDIDYFTAMSVADSNPGENNRKFLYERNRVKNDTMYFYCMSDLEKKLHNASETFSEMLMRKISEKKMSASECYKRANISRKLFSKIKNDHCYKPSKATVLAFAISLRLSVEETEKLLQTAGYAFSNSTHSDIIIKYFISKKNYDIYKINEILFSFGEKLLGE